MRLMDGVFFPVGVVDSRYPAYQTNLQTAVNYINSGSSGLLAGHTVAIEFVTSKDNDSFGAMDQGETKCDQLYFICASHRGRDDIEG